jgi:hypothetical protein
LGLVILLLVGTIYWALASQSSVPFDAQQERMYVLGVLEDDVQYNLNQMKLNEARKIFMLQYGLTEDQDYASLAEQSDAQAGEILSSLSDEGYFTADEDAYIRDSSQELQRLNDLRSVHQETFRQTVAAFQAEDYEQGSALVEKMQDENEALDKALQALILGVEQDRVHAYRDFPADINLSIYIATIGITAALLLGLIGYQLIAAAIRPLKSLFNITTAIEGDQYRPEVYSELIKKKGPAGDLARALDHLADGIQKRDTTLKSEIEQLRQELYASRRRRLKVYQNPTARGDES